MVHLNSESQVTKQREDPPYLIVTADQLTLLTLEVNDYVRKGYSPVGGITIEGLRYMQPMFKPLHSVADVGTGDESAVQPARAKRRATVKRPVQRGD